MISVTSLRPPGLALLLLLLTTCTATRPEPPAPARYAPSWESLAANERQPDWFRDAKLGIYFHWGVYSVPAFANEWYPRWMYVPDRGEEWGHEVYPHHRDTYGADFDYHEFIPDFTAEHFDPAGWAELFAAAGARFAGPVAQRHDGFAMWDSALNPWNAADRGPRRDLAGEMLRAVRARGLKTIATFHHAKLLQRYARDTAEWVGNGPDPGHHSHYPYHPDLVTSTTDPELRYLYGNIPEAEFHDYWLGQVAEVVDAYAPDAIWFDSWLFTIPEEYRRRMVAHHFNAATARGQQPIVCYKNDQLPAHIGVLDIEQGGKKELSPDYWLTDITISNNSWSYVEGQTYKDPALVIRNMIDVWSKRGVVLLNVSPTAQGIIPAAQREVLGAIGDWIRKHEEAVYATRAFTTFGYGPATIEDGHFGGQTATIAYGPEDLRFTRARDRNSVYVYALGQPAAGTELVIEQLLGGAAGAEITGVRLVGPDRSLKWRTEGDRLILQLPAAEYLDGIATVFRVDFGT